MYLICLGQESLKLGFGGACKFEHTRLAIISVLNAPVPTNKVSIFKLTIEKQYDTKIKVKFTSLDATKFCILLYFFLGASMQFSPSFRYVEPTISGPVTLNQ